jgi:hypothetical protein
MHPCEANEVQVRGVDPRDTQWEVSSPSYRVYFWERQESGGYWSDEFELDGAIGVEEVLPWAEERAEGRTFVVYAALTVGGEPGLVRLAGVDPVSTATSP